MIKTMSNNITTRQLEKLAMTGQRKQLTQNISYIVNSDIYSRPVDELIKYATKKSPLNENEMQEGIVIRPLIEQTEEINGTIGRFSFKVISNEYLLKHES